jgi:hypothetical protein
MMTKLHDLWHACTDSSLLVKPWFYFAAQPTFALTRL